jgi:hypothetical protein
VVVLEGDVGTSLLTDVACAGAFCVTFSPHFVKLTLPAMVCLLDAPVVCSIGYGGPLAAT